MKHSPALPTDILYRFGEFVVDPVIGRLHYHADEVALTRKTFELLAALVEREGRLVEKDDLFRLIWPDTIVEDNNLARCVSMLRKALRDRDPLPEFVITVPGRGYQFGLPVERIRRGELAAAFEMPGRDPAQSALAPTQEGDPAANTAQQWTLTPAPALHDSSPHATAPAPTLRLLVAVGVLGVATLILIWAFTRPATPNGEKRLWQLTSMSGLEVEPTWSPDGQFVAYSSNRSGNFDIWIQPVLGGSPIQVTSSQTAESQPAWSPDGRLIAFRSERDGGGLFLVPAFGGAARRLADFGQHPMWSPDGSKLLFYMARRPLDNRAFVSTMNDHPPHEILAAALGELSSFRMAWHPDGERVSVLGFLRDRTWTFFTAALDGTARVESTISRPVRQRLNNLGLQLGRFVWGRDGRSLLVEGKSARQAQNVFRISVDPTTLEWIDGPTPLTTSTNTLTDLALSADGRRLAFSSRVAETRVWWFPLSGDRRRVAGDGEPITPEGTDVIRFEVSHDGKRLAYWTERNGQQELWIRWIREEREELKRIEEEGGRPFWSPDDKQIGYKRRTGLLDSPELVVVSLTEQPDHAVRGAWPSAAKDWTSRQTILLGCPVESRNAVCSMELGPGVSSELRVVAADSSRSLFEGQMSPDGRWITFIARTDASKSTVYVMPANGGAWIPLSTDGHPYVDKPRWSFDSSTVYFLSDRFGVLSVWGRRVDRDTGRPVGASFQVMELETPDRIIPDRMTGLQTALTRDRLVLPLTDVSGAVWVLDDFDR